jgi:heavy metal sensor kinase
MSFRSIQVRLTLWYSAVMALGLGLFAGVMWFALQHRLVADVDERLAEQVSGLQAVIEGETTANERSVLQEETAEFARELPEHTYIQLRDESGRVIVTNTSEGETIPVERVPGYQTIEFVGKPFRMFNGAIKHGGQVYATTVVTSLEDVEEIIHDFRNLLLIVIPAILGFSSFGGYWMSRRALAPVDGITRVAKSITVQNLSRRLDVPDTCDELQRMSEAWNEVLERLDSAVQKIVQFTADASHELRTPTAVIRTAAELALRSDRETDQYKETLRIVEREAKRITELTESLLTLARMDSNSVDMPLVPVDVRQLSTELVRHLSSVTAERRISIRAECDLSRSIALANEAGLRRLILILLDNAIKYTNSGGNVALSLVRGNGRLWITVRDSGEGIAPEHLPHIFERFYRVDAARSKHEGTGLGLSIAKTIAEAHGTKIEVQSAPGSGSSFTFSLLEYGGSFT